MSDCMYMHNDMQFAAGSAGRPGKDFSWTT
jgi:hypothetical protein